MIPNKSVFKFQELTPITGVKPYVIRFWETEFEEISPVVSDSGQKLYARKDIDIILSIKKLLFDEKKTIQEAKIALRSEEKQSYSEVTVSPEAREAFQEVTVDMDFVKNALHSSLQLIQDIKIKRNW